MGPLDGVTVVEMGGFIAGPFAAQLLGDLGARVIKIEPPSGDPMRHWGIQRNDRSLWWPSIARNKESVVLDMKDDAQRTAAAELLVAADIVVENFAPGRLASWELDYATLAQRNPRLIMVHVSGFGHKPTPFCRVRAHPRCDPATQHGDDISVGHNARHLNSLAGTRYQRDNPNGVSVRVVRFESG